MNNKNHKVYNIFLKDALIKLDRVNDERLDLQAELVEKENGEIKEITEVY